MKKIKKHTGLIAALCVFLALTITVAGAACIYSRFGGFGTGECADTTEFSKYAVDVSKMSIPEETQILALGEATHGNKEFQKLRLDVFKVAVEKYGVRAFALEGDFGGCEKVNRYINGGDGTAKEALSAIGFAIYRTDEMESLVEWMRDYNNTAENGEKLRFYGFDMEQYAYNYCYFLEALKNENADVSELEKIWDSEKNAYKDAYTSEQCAEVIEAAKKQLSPENEKGIHFADVLLQNIELGKHMKDVGDMNAVRDSIMAENALWILKQEQSRGNSRIMISGHNNHIMKCENGGTSVLGSLLFEKLGGGYYAVGTDFYKSVCNLPKMYTGKRVVHTFYSYDPLAKASKKCGFEESFLDFSKVPESSSLNKYIVNNINMGSLGESYSILMSFLPRSYRVVRMPQKTYDAMIFVGNATPIEINKQSAQ